MDVGEKRKENRNKVRTKIIHQDGNTTQIRKKGRR